MPDVRQCRQSCFQSSLWGEVVVTSAKGEPPFPTQALLMVLLLVVVVVSQVLMYAFWTANVRSRSVGQGTRQQKCRVGHVNGASVHSPAPVATTSGTTTVGLAFSGAHGTAVGPSNPFPPPTLGGFLRPRVHNPILPCHQFCAAASHVRPPPLQP
jgi:hypothetical protein